LADKVSPLILIVDDDDSARSILVETLKGEGYILGRLVRACQQRTSAG
jgi:CheY-like chemotaxis protein